MNGRVVWDEESMVSDEMTYRERKNHGNPNLRNHRWWVGRFDKYLYYLPFLFPSQEIGR